MYGASPLTTFELLAAAEFGIDPDDASVGDLIVGVAGAWSYLAVASEGNLLIPQADGTLAWEDAFTSDTGPLKHERGGLEFDASAVTTGDLIRGSAAGTMSILNVGADGEVLTAQADGSVAWEALTLKAPVKAATTANITLSGEQTIDGVSVVAGDRVLVKDQSTGTENGIYVAAAGAWSRAADYATGDSVAATFGHIEQGTVGGDKKWLCTNNSGSDVVNTDALVYTTSSTTSVGGPGSSTDNAIARFDGTDGSTIQNSSATVDDNGRVKAAIDADGGYGFSSGTGLISSESGSGNLNVQAEVNKCFLAIGDVGIKIQDGTFLYRAFITGANNGPVDWETSNLFALTLTANSTPTFTDPKLQSGAGAHPALLFLKVIQDATGNRTITWPASVKWAGGTAPTLTTTANAVDLIQFVFDGTNYYGTVLGLDMQ